MRSQKCWWFLLVLGSLLLASAAQAEELRWKDLFAQHGIAEEGAPEQRAQARGAVARVVDVCQENKPGGREGPSVLDIARCEQAVRRLLTLGPRSVTAIFRALDGRENVGNYGRVRLFDVLARVAPDPVVGVLVTALERAEAQARPEMPDELVMVLQRLTWAPAGETAPWQEAPSVAIATNGSSQSDMGPLKAPAWRTWWQHHQREARREWQQQARQGLRQVDPAAVFCQAHVLGVVAGKNDEARQGLRQLRARPNLSPEIREALGLEVKTLGMEKKNPGSLSGSPQNVNARVNGS